MSEAFPILRVDDLPAVVGFYEELGFVRTYAFPDDGEPGFVTLERNGDAIGIAVGDPNDPSPFSYWVYVDVVDAIFMRLVDAGVVAVAEPHDEPWGERVASVRDPAGNLVHIGAAAGGAL